VLQKTIFAGGPDHRGSLFLFFFFSFLMNYSIFSPLYLSKIQEHSLLQSFSLPAGNNSLKIKSHGKLFSRGNHIRNSHETSHESLVRFTCVSKAWCSIISNPSFASAHVAHTHNNNIYHCILLLAVSCEALEDVNHRRKFTTTVITPCLGKQVIDEQDQSTKSFDLHKPRDEILLQ
jgi:hypothetical protein